jgi:release factor glutamine methyltransferase
MTVMEAVRAASAKLGSSGCPSPRVDAELLLCHLLDLSRHQLFMEGRRNLDGTLLDEYFGLVDLRSSRIPLQHVTGSAWFMGRRFLAGLGALVPRYETEVLVEKLLEAVRPGPSLILDVGTGSGVIAVTLALELPEALVVGTDSSPGAIRLAARNAALHGTDNIRLVLCDLAAPLRGGFDAVAANLPYIRQGELPSLEPEVRQDPRAALDGGPDGLSVIGRFLEEAPGIVRRGGIIALEASGGQPFRISRMLERSGEWTHVERGPDLSGRMRWVTAART